MSFDWSIDPIALYAAILSTLIAVVQFVLWWQDRPKVSVTVINPKEVRRLDWRLMELIVSNVGKEPVVVQEAIISYHEGKSHNAEGKTARFYSGAGWDPSLKDVPHPTKPNTTTASVNLIKPGDELRQMLKPFSDYDPTKHWLKAVVRIRNSNSRFIGWAGPVLEGNNND